MAATCAILVTCWGQVAWTLEVDSQLTTFYNFDYVTRKEWRARPSKEKILLELPIPYVVIHHTYIPPVCYTKEKGCEVMRQIQDMHMDVNNWVDIGYNLTVGGDGIVYEGRGWTTLGAHAKNFNHVSLGVCLIGDWRDSIPLPDQLKAVHSILEAGVRLGYLKSDFKLIGHRQVKATECPGNALFDHIRNWEHYSAYPSSFNDLLTVKEIPEDIRKEVAKQISLE